jgi:hypothetical protein
MAVYYISRYYASEGIVKTQGAPLNTNPNTILTEHRRMYYKLGVDAHVNRASAVVAARLALLKRIKGMRRQLANLEAVEIV